MTDVSAPDPKEEDWDICIVTQRRKEGGLTRLPHGSLCCTPWMLLQVLELVTGSKWLKNNFPKRIILTLSMLSNFWKKSEYLIYTSNMTTHTHIFQSNTRSVHKSQWNFQVHTHLDTLLRMGRDAWLPSLEGGNGVQLMHFLVCFWVIILSGWVRVYGLYEQKVT